MGFLSLYHGIHRSVIILLYYTVLSFVCGQTPLESTAYNCTDEDCTIWCNITRCSDALIYAPINVSLNVYCLDGLGSCNGAAILGHQNDDLNFTLSDTILQITARGEDALKESQIYCPFGAGNCLINLSGDYKGMLTDARIYAVNGFEDISLFCNTSDIEYCYNTSAPPHLFCSSDYGVECNIKFNSYWECEDNNSTDLCNDNTENGYYGDTFVCNKPYECSTLICNDNKDCLVDCGVENSCHSSSIHAPQNANLVVNCTGISSCKYMTINGAENGNLSVKCTGDHGCHYANIFGPKNGSLFVECTDNVYSCKSADIYGPIYGDLTVICDHITSCKNIDVDATKIVSGNLLIESMNQHPFGSAFIKCPGNSNDCMVYCGKNGCKSWKFSTQSDTAKLEIVAVGAFALKNSKIYCPSDTDTECSINLFGDNLDMLTDATIYAINGFEDISLFCNASIPETYCYDTLNKAHLFCSSKYQVGCNIELESGYTNWQCTENNSTDLCNDNTKNGYYGNYFVCDEGHECDIIICNDNKDCLVECQVSKSCRSGIINGPQNGNLMINCTEKDSCNKVFINGSISNNVTIECRKPESCDEMTLYCPTETGECAITLFGDDVNHNVNLLRGTNIYAINGFEDVSLFCKASDPANCYDNSQDPSMLFCLSDYSASCNISFLSELNEWQCMNHRFEDVCNISFAIVEPTFDSNASRTVTTQEGNEHDDSDDNDDPIAKVLSKISVIGSIVTVCICFCCCIIVLYCFIINRKRDTVKSEQYLGNDIEMNKEEDGAETIGNIESVMNDDIKTNDNSMEEERGRDRVKEHEIGENRKREGSIFDSNNNDEGASKVNTEGNETTKGHCDNIAEDEFIIRGDDELIDTKHTMN